MLPEKKIILRYQVSGLIGEGPKESAGDRHHLTRVDDKNQIKTLLRGVFKRERWVLAVPLQGAIARKTAENGNGATKT